MTAPEIGTQRNHDKTHVWSGGKPIFRKERARIVAPETSQRIHSAMLEMAVKRGGHVSIKYRHLYYGMIQAMGKFSTKPTGISIKTNGLH
jgi:hypothetical protein